MQLLFQTELLLNQVDHYWQVFVLTLPVKVLEQILARCQKLFTRVELFIRALRSSAAYLFYLNDFDPMTLRLCSLRKMEADVRQA